MAAVFSAQGWGNLLAAVVSVIVVQIYKNPIENGPVTVDDVDYLWRLLIGIGCVPGVMGLYFRSGGASYSQSLFPLSRLLWAICI
jgi:PHS family inorganic phosphate transporter-like MFS transporter